MEIKPIPEPRAARLSDIFGRKINYLRLSVTDRCNLRCFYCMGSDVKFLPRTDVLSLEEMERLSAIFIRLGVRKLRLTGGEPLARPGIMTLVQRLSERLVTGELAELTLTTNGTLLQQHARGLVAAGMRRINVSLDTLDRQTFKRITGHDGLHATLAGIEAARDAGLAVRINTVALAGINDHEFDRLIAWSGERGCDMALIEQMPLGGCGQPDAKNYLPLKFVARRLAEHWTLEPLDQGEGGPAAYLRIAETGRRVGFITPMSHSFCLQCNRVRLTCTGSLVLCLAREDGIDLRGLLRRGDNDEVVADAIMAAILRKPLEHTLTHGSQPDSRAQRMWQVGG